MKKVRVYIHSHENGVAQIGNTVFQPPTGAIWNASMKGCTEENCIEVEGGKDMETAKKALQESYR